jgi:ribosome biogenesis GTPase
MVVRTDRGRYATLLTDQTRAVTAMKARELGRTSIVVGDLVYLVGDVTGGEGTLARIVRVAPRRTQLRRSADDSDPVERVIVAGADQLVIVTSLADPPPRPRLIDRCLVAAYDAGMTAALSLTKSDLASQGALRALYEPLGVEVVTTGLPDDAGGDLDAQLDGLGEVQRLLADRVSVLVGHSGVGKSTLVNALVPGAARQTGAVNEVTGRGRHTSTGAIALPLPGGGWVIDTPGIRSFGLAHVQDASILAAFPDLDEAARECPRGCTHLAGSPDCDLDQWADTDVERCARLDSFRRLLAVRSEEPRR